MGPDPVLAGAHRPGLPWARGQRRLTQLVLARAARELDDQQLPAVEAAPDAVGPGDVRAAGRRPLQHAHHLGVGVVREVEEGGRQARGRRLLCVQAPWGDAGAGLRLRPAATHPPMAAACPRRPSPWLPGTLLAPVPSPPTPLQQLGGWGPWGALRWLPNHCVYVLK